jgi:hypothetical protein
MFRLIHNNNKNMIDNLSNKVLMTDTQLIWIFMLGLICFIKFINVESPVRIEPQSLLFEKCIWFIREEIS